MVCQQAQSCSKTFPWAPLEPWYALQACVGWCSRSYRIRPSGTHDCNPPPLSIGFSRQNTGVDTISVRIFWPRDEQSHIYTDLVGSFLTELPKSPLNILLKALPPLELTPQPSTYQFLFMPVHISAFFHSSKMKYPRVTSFTPVFGKAVWRPSNLAAEDTKGLRGHEWQKKLDSNLHLLIPRFPVLLLLYYSHWSKLKGNNLQCWKFSL